MMQEKKLTRSLFFCKNNIPLKGEITVSPDKSISHRALIFASLAHGTTKISNLLEGEDVLKTAASLKIMGVGIERKSAGNWEINGSGIVGLMEPSEVLDMGNSGTAARLLAGLVASYNFTTFFSGDESLRKRPMGRIFEPIKEFGATIIARQNNLMPFAIVGTKNPLPISYKMKMASAQVKSCILLASLAIRGTTTIIEPEKCRNHTEIMMEYLGLRISSQNFENGTKISYSGLQEFSAKNFDVPNDISSAAFFIVAALLIKDSKLLIKNVGVNPLRTGIITTLTEMGGKISLQNERLVGGEMVADVLVEYSKLKGVVVPPQRAASMIDEYPILSVAAANAEGITIMKGLAELKVKESNRLLMIANNLENCGVAVKMKEDSLEINGGFKQQKQKIKVITAMDHRIAMSFLVMGLVMENGVEIDDSSMIATSFPDFEKIFSQLGVV
jgi:3-phosphoshikimate 1-carboxyvinyltransferase